MARVGLIGCGKIAEKHAEAYAAIGDVDLVAYDVDPARSRAFAERHEASIVGSLEELLGDPTIDVVDTCVPTSYHTGVIVSALRAGKHVFAEKPLCETQQEAIQIFETAERFRRVVHVGYPLRFYPAFEFVKDLLDKGAIGDPYMALMRIGGRGNAAVWKHRRAEGGGALSEMMVHLLDLAVWLFGSFEAATALFSDTLLQRRTIQGKVIHADAEDLAMVRLSRPGMTVMCESDLCTPSYSQHLEIQGTNGSIFASLLDYMPTIVHCVEARGGQPAGTERYKFSLTNVFIAELRYFLSRARDPDGWNDIVMSLNVVRLFEEVRNGLVFAEGDR